MQVDWYIVTAVSKVLAPPSDQCVSEIILSFNFWRSAKCRNNAILHETRMNCSWHRVALLHLACHEIVSKEMTSVTGDFANIDVY